MAIIFEKKEEGQKNLIIISIFLFLIIVFIIWFVFFRKETVTPVEEIKIVEVKLEDLIRGFIPALEKLDPFPKIEKIETGRENPFIP